MDAGMPMPALVSSMPMPSYNYQAYPTQNSDPSAIIYDPVHNNPSSCQYFVVTLSNSALEAKLNLFVSALAVLKPR
jgi:hypothetical protein